MGLQSKVFGAVLVNTVLLTAGVMAATTTEVYANGKTVRSAVCSVSDVKVSTLNATECQGPFSGNDTGAGNPLLTRLNNGLFSGFSSSTGSWSLLGKSDSGGFMTAGSSNTGNWTLSSGRKLSDVVPSTAGKPATGTFVLSLKSSTAYTAYLFKDISTLFTGGTFNTIGVDLDGSGRQGKGLSHASLFYYQPKMDAPEPPPSTYQPVPEPFTILGTVAAAGFGFGLKRKRDQSK